MNHLQHLYTFIVLALLVSSTAFAQQTSHVITYNEQGITIDGVNVSIKNTVKQLEDLIGTKARKQQFAGEAYAHIFDDSGIVVYSNENHIQGLTLNFVENFEPGGPTSAFIGNFSINTTPVSKKTTRKKIYKLSDVDMHCPGDSYCDIQILQTPASCIVSFTKKGKVALVNFTFAHPYLQPTATKKTTN